MRRFGPDRAARRSVAAKPAAAYTVPVDAFISADNFVGRVYDSLNAGRSRRN